MNIKDKQKKEIEFWKTDEIERPESNAIENLINKFSEAAVLIEALNSVQFAPQPQAKVLEIGGGQGWASAVIKRLNGNISVKSTDISEYAVASQLKWTSILGVELEPGYACKSYETNEPDGSIDCVFAYSAAHHFIAHRRTFRELHRILKPNGKAYYFYEPATPKIFYKFALWRVNRKRPDVPEDVLITKKIKALAKEFGLETKVHFFPSTTKRGGVESAYYLILSRFRILCRMLPCTINFEFTKLGK